MLHSLDRVVLAVAELDVAVRQYVRLLGRTPSWRGEQPAAGTQSSLFRLGNTALEIVAPTSRGGAGHAASSAPWGAGPLRASLNAQGDGLLALAFGTDDAEAFRSALVERGLQATPVEKQIDRDVDSGAFWESRRVGLSTAASRGLSLSAVEPLSPDEVVPMAPALAEEEACVFALDHVVVQTRDADATRSLFGDALGLRVALDREFPQWGSRLQFFRVGGATIEVASSLEKVAEVDARQSVAADAPSDRDRLWGLCWRVRDASLARLRMSEAGFDVSDVRDGRKPGTRVFTVRDGTCGVPTLVLEPGRG